MKRPLVIHYRCLDTFGLRGVAQSFGAGAAGVRLTTAGLAAYVRASRTQPIPSVALPAPPAAPPEPEEERVETFSRTPLLPPRPRAARPSMPSLVTIEMGLHKPTTWAVLLLTLGVTFGVVLARVASHDRAAVVHAATAAAANPAMERVSWPQTAREGVVTQDATTLPTTVISADPSSPPDPPAHASSAQTRALRSSRSHRAAAPQTAEGEKTATPASNDETDDPTVAASSSLERVQRELADSL